MYSVLHISHYGWFLAVTQEDNLDEALASVRNSKCMFRVLEECTKMH